MSAGAGELGAKVSPVHVVPGTTGEPGDRIDAMDVAIGPAQALHVVWREVDHNPEGGLPSYRTLYAHREGGGSWSSPEELWPSSGASPRIFRAPGGVHVLAGSELRHRYRGDDGVWRDLGQMIPEGSHVAQGQMPGLAYFDVAVDAAMIGDELAVVYLVRRRARGPLALDLARWSPGDAGLPQRLAEFSNTVPQQPAPRLLAVDQRLHLLWAVGEEVRETVERGTGAVESYSSRARLFYMGSEDRGDHWGEPVEVTERLPEPPQVIDDLELLVTAAGLIACYNSRGLYLSRSVDGHSWSRPVRIAGYRERSGTTSTGSWSLTAAAGAVAWIDERFQSSSRRWWKPLAGWPWSDSPDGINNDVFFLSKNTLERALVGGHVEPQRQTTESSFAFLVRLRASREHLYLVWTGHRRAGETVGAHPVPPEIFYRTLAP